MKVVRTGSNIAFEKLNEASPWAARRASGGTGANAQSAASRVLADRGVRVAEQVQGMRSKCSRPSCHEQSVSGSRFCEEHDPARKSDPRGRAIPISLGGGGGRSG